ncbi:MAG: LptF/LptG family permease, partial [Balneolaceae bacterium]|nr:LptF/LptG family permease [Balneolaceae bacterium]
MLNHVQIDLLKKHIGPFLFCFTTLMFVLLMQFLILHVDKLVGKGLPFLIVIELILNNLAYMVVLAAPMAVLVSTLIAFGRFSEWNELTAIRAAGINPIKLITPVMGAGFLLFLFMGYFSNYILPESNHKARSLFIDIRTQKPAFDLKPSTFYNDIEGYTFLIKEIDSETDSLYDVRVFQDETDNRNRAIINANRGWL